MKQRFHVIDALLRNKANPNDVNMSGWNCLISAVNYFHEDCATMLLLLLQVIRLLSLLDTKKPYLISESHVHIRKLQNLM